MSLPFLPALLADALTDITPDLLEDGHPASDAGF